MNRSYSKIRHIQESNQRLENRLLNEQTTGGSEDLWVTLLNKLGKDKFTIKGPSATLSLPDESVLMIGNSPKGFGVSIDLPDGVTESGLTKELLKFGNGGWSTKVGNYNWPELTESDLTRIVKRVVEENEMTEEGSSRYMFFSNLQQMKRQCEYLLDFDEEQVEEILNNGHDWAQDHISEAKNNMDQVFDFLMNEIKGDDADVKSESYLPNIRGKKIYEDQYGSVEILPIQESEYKGRKVTLNKPFYTPDGPKKRSVYVKNSKGNIVKVNFGDPNMEIKRDSPSHRKSFRARHKCSEKKDKTTPGYWSCKAW